MAYNRGIPEQEESMIALSVTLKAQAGKEKEMEAVLRRLVEHTQTEEGTLEYVVHQSAEDPSTFLVYELYEDQAALDRHVTSEGFRALGKEMAGCMDGRAAIARFSLLARVQR
jgi:quinol monooxygenase YgiN